MPTVLILILLTVCGTKVVNSSDVPVADVYIRISETSCLEKVDDNLQLAESCNDISIYQAPGGGYLIRVFVGGKYLAIQNPVLGETMTLNETGTVFSFGGRECIYDTFNSTDPIQLLVEGESGCINESLVYTEDCDNSVWYLESTWNCVAQTGQGCNTCYGVSSASCTECGEGLALNGTSCAECPAGYEADTCGQECVELPTTTGDPITDQTKDPMTDSVDPEDTTAGCGGSPGFFKPMGAVLLLASFLLA